LASVAFTRRQWGTRIHIRARIQPGAARTHGISATDLKGCPPFPAALAQFFAFVESCLQHARAALPLGQPVHPVLASRNGKFDHAMLLMNAQRHGRRWGGATAGAAPTSPLEALRGMGAHFACTLTLIRLLQSEGDLPGLARKGQRGGCDMASLCFCPEVDCAA